MLQIYIHDNFSAIPNKGYILKTGYKKRQQFHQLRKNHCHNKRKLFKFKLSTPYKIILIW